MKIEHVLFPSFFKITDPCVGRSFSMCSYDPMMFGTNKNGILKNGSCEWAFSQSDSLVLFGCFSCFANSSQRTGPLLSVVT